MKRHKGSIPPIGSVFTHNPKYSGEDVFIVINHNEDNNCKNLINKHIYHCGYNTDMWLLSQEEIDNLKVKLL
jgi:hypothetical protein